jgi:hypothetical protein
MEPEASRQCGDCTACCDGWLKIVVHGHAIRPGKPCPFGSARGCTIYATRPHDPCRAFVCGWLLRNSPLPEWMRPDKADLILLPANFTWHGQPVDVAVPAGQRPKTKALEWLKAFAADKRRLLLYGVADEWYAFGPPAFQADMRQRISKGERLWG